jgi:hypothetical protein
MSATFIDWQDVRKQLRGKRKELFAQFEKNPANIRLAPEIKHLDDQIVECSEHTRREYESHRDIAHIPLT